MKLPADLPPIPLDDVLIEQVFINLLENAIKYTPAGSPIEIVATATAKGAVEVEVADRGPGVPAEERDHVFEKFYRLNARGAQGGAPASASPSVAASSRRTGAASGSRIARAGARDSASRLPIEGTPPVVAS